MAAISTLLLAVFSLFCDICEIPASKDVENPNIVQQADLIFSDENKKSETGENQTIQTVQPRIESMR